MAKKRQAFVHIGLDDGSGDFVDTALETHGHALAELGVRRPAESGEEMFRAALEILRAHQAWGYQRHEVEGAWTGVVRRGLKGKDTLVFSQPLLAAATAEQAALLVDALAGFEVHVVVTAHAPDAWTVPGEPTGDLGAVLERWQAAVADPGHLHVICGGDRSTTWKALGKVVGFGTKSLRVTAVPTAARPRPSHLSLASRATVLTALGQSWVELLEASSYDVRGEVNDLVPQPRDIDASADAAASSTEHELEQALRHVERLTRRNATLELRLESLQKKRKKLKRRLSAVA